MRRLLIVAIVASCLPIAVAAAQHQVVQKDNVRVSFGGRLVPHSLPRERLAPVTVHLGGSVGTVDGSSPPRLREISIAVNRAGRLSVAGLPTCTTSELQQTSSEAALDHCRDALVGDGSWAAGVDSADTTTAIPVGGRVLVFNSGSKRNPEMLLHLYGTRPVRAAFIVPFQISRSRRGEFGTVFSARIPKLASDSGYVTDIQLTIGRRYRHGGQPRSFLSASCAAPAGFPGATYQLAKATFTFPEARMTSRLPSDCRVR